MTSRRSPGAGGHSPSELRSEPGSSAPTLLRALVIERHWQKFTTFERQFLRAARELADQAGEPELAKVTVSSRQFERWYAGKVKTEPYPDACRILEFMFGHPVARLLAPARPGAGVVSGLLGSEDAASLTGWLTASSVGDEAVAGVDRAASRLADAHGLAAPVLVLAEARQVQAGVQAMLRGGRLRHRQARELLRIDGALLAHVGLLLSDLGDDAAGEEYASAALLYLGEAGAAEPPAWYVLAKIARWRHQYARAADLAARGLEHAGPGPMAVQLACYEANASALAGDPARARAAMGRAEDADAALPPGDMTLSPWSFPAERMAMFRLSVALGTGDPGGALAVAAAADPGLAPGRPRNPAALAQIRIGAAIAHLATGDLDGAAEQVAPVLELPPEFRIATVTGWLAGLDGHLAASRHVTSPAAAGLRQQIRQFTTTPEPHLPGGAAGFL